MPDLGALFGQLQPMMQPYDGSLNWDVATDLARKAVASSPDPTPSAKQSDAVADAVRLADHWLDETTPFPSGVTSTAAWSRAEWVVGTLDVWKVLVEPVAEQSVKGIGGALPPEAQAAAAPILGLLGKAVGAMLATPGRLRPRRAGRRGARPPPTSGCRSARPARRRWSRAT